MTPHLSGRRENVRAIYVFQIRPKKYLRLRFHIVKKLGSVGRLIFFS